MFDYDVEWKNHATESFEFLAKYQREDRFTDVSIYCSSGSGVGSDGYVSAHRVVLSACSAYLDRVFERLLPHSSHPGLAQQTVVLLPDAAPDILELAVEFMYTGEVSVQVEKFDSFLKLGRILEIRGLRDARESTETTATVANDGIAAEEALLRETVPKVPRRAVPARDGSLLRGLLRKRKPPSDLGGIGIDETSDVFTGGNCAESKQHASVTERIVQTRRTRSTSRKISKIEHQEDNDEDAFREGGNLDSTLDDDGPAESDTSGCDLGSDQASGAPLADKPVFEFIPSRFGSQSVFYDGYFYTFFKLNKDGATWWRCGRRKNGCYSGLKLNKEKTKILFGPDRHSHESTSAEVAKARLLIAKLKQEAGNRNATGKDIENFVISSGVSTDVIAALPSKGALKRVMRRAYLKNMASSSAAVETEATENPLGDSCPHEDLSPSGTADDSSCT